ncbi:glycoside hydrolase family 2 protein [Pelagovum pacificum]|uniref:Glycoside hydrolase family 2 protein n=1 Tax=Pelagovum pacificum TaxID=2588711 RepID=A0A5C5GG22_9RHOB|nr:glycoside hydrolase family 2 TIM barrel-domain containing protein [Pelagovum pacificum]QQA43861.1 glycoside hydrolase family 2 protein [Pelagovum pacificum]TNY33007.1 glycoside hydrolase family 2 protein [Pelagovum pacificum]
MRFKTDFNDGWIFEGKEEVRLPHTAVDLPFNYLDETSYQRPFTYEKRFKKSADWDGKEVAVHFEGAMANAKVSLNGEELLTHPDGYTPFELRLTDRLTDGENVLTVVIDGSENPEIPPFGGQIDYLTYAGIYRDVWLRITSPVAIGPTKIETPDALADAKTVTARVELDNPQGLPLDGTLKAELLDATGAPVAETQADAAATVNLNFEQLTGLELWDLHQPTLYTLRLTLTTGAGEDVTETRFGFRTAEFTTEGFFLNGRHLKIRGLNRHQSFPYAGYALGNAAQRADADILKNDLRLNLVRTSHYPQSVAFLDRCDEIGLLVFEEIPGWQHIGGEGWKAESVENVRRMIRRDWNHPSIILWGVRINESPDDHDFYVATNKAARELDTTRQTGGVRCHTDSEFLEDVYTMNDFIMGEFEVNGNRTRMGLRSIAETTGLDQPVPYLVTEFNGHMYPTKIFDQEQRQAEHVTRHLEVLDAAYGDPQVSGCIGWCAFDYNTHKDFGSGDRICYHGVMDMFREPKFAAHVYASQGDPDGGAVLEPVTFWSRGERNIGGVLPLIILTNCDEIEVEFGGYKTRIKPDRERFPHLPHPPVIADKQHFGGAGGTWGMSWLTGKLTGYVDGKAVMHREFVPDPLPTTLEVEADADTLAVHDEVRVMIRALDQAGNKLPFFFDPVEISLDGPARLVGPATPPMRGGSTGAWIKATGPGQITLTVTQAALGTQTITLTAEDVP